MSKLSSKLRKYENNIDISIIYIYLNFRKYLEILLIKFIERNRRWLPPRHLAKFGISCKPLR